MYKGKCCDCDGDKSLDEMIKKEKGLYRCKDCVTDEVMKDYVFPDTPDPVPSSRLRKIFRWCFG